MPEVVRAACAEQPRLPVHFFFTYHFFNTYSLRKGCRTLSVATLSCYDAPYSLIYKLDIDTFVMRA
mgnify:CR=1 FL=1